MQAFKVELSPPKLGTDYYCSIECARQDGFDTADGEYTPERGFSVQTRCFHCGALLNDYMRAVMDV